MYSDKRKSGIAQIGDLSWGSHFCQFYRTWKDLFEVLVPYFKAGLESNEFCVLVTSGTLGAGDALKGLTKEVPDIGKYADKGQMELIPCGRWRTRDGKSGSDIVSMLDKAVLGGFDGLRLAIMDLFPAKAGGEVYGADTIGRNNVIALFAYPRDRFDALAFMELVKNHRFALVPNAGGWEVIESSEARVVKDELKRSEEKLRSLFSNMLEGFAYHRIMLDDRGTPRDFIFLEVNEAFERFTGLNGKEIVGKRATEILPGIENDPTDWIGRFGEVALSGKPVCFESRSEALKKWYQVSAFSPHKGYFAVTFSDITERKRADEEILRLNEELKQHVLHLEAANRELETFSYSVSHDLRAPLRAIDGFARILMEDYETRLDDEGNRVIAVIRENTRRMGQLIDEILAFSRIGRQEMRRTVVPMHVLAREVFDELKSAEEERTIRFTLGPLPPAQGDPALIRQVLQNLLSNSIKYTRPREVAEVEMGSRRGDGEQIYFVRDNGIGFDMKYCDKLFGVFQRLHGSEEFEGTGVGLAIVQRIVLRHGGRVWGEGKKDEGATFYFTLQAEKADVFPVGGPMTN